jgi:hypothetical protein
MNDRITDAARSPLAAARMCQEAPRELIHSLREYDGLSRANQGRIDALVARAAGDPDLGCRLTGLVRHDGFQASDEAHQAILLDAIAREPDADNLGRMEVLADDPEFRHMMPREAARQAEEVQEGKPFPGVEEMVRGSGARPHQNHSFSLPGAIELGAHAAEIVVDVALEHFAVTGVGAVPGSAVAAGAAAAVLGIAAVGAGLWELAEAHRAGQEWGESVAAGQGFVAQMAHHMRGDDAVAGRGPRGTGAAAADRFWQNLSPSQRVELRTVEGQDQVLGALAASVERITLGARGQAA